MMPANVLKLKKGIPLIFFLSFVLSITLFASNPALATGSAVPQVDSLLFNESKISISGRIDEGCDVIIKVIGAEKKMAMGGNSLYPSSYYTVENLPSQYKVLFSGNIADVKPEIRNCLNIQENFGFLKNKASVYFRKDEQKVLLAGPEGEKKANTAIAAQELNGNYRYLENSIKIKDGKFSGAVSINSDEYSPVMELQVSTIKDGLIISQSSKAVRIPVSILARDVDMENDPFLYAGIFLCLTILAVTAVDEIIMGRGGKTACR